jgi:hypothetical protein
VNPFPAIGVVGIRSAFWYAVYRLELLSGACERSTPVSDWSREADRLAFEPSAADPVRQPPFFFDDPRALGEAIRRTSPDAAGGLKDELDRARRGSFRMWEDEFRDCGFPPEWNRNVLSGVRLSADRHWTAVDETTGGDLKGVWELSRFSFVFRLARHYALTGEETAAELFWRLVESWLAADPPNAGPQWMSAQEAGLRAMAWIFGWRAFLRSPATTPGRSKALIAALDGHARRIEATTAYARAQNNNHLISEAAALFTLGLLLPFLPEAERWRRLGRSLLSESSRQFFSDGGYIQHSHNYHRLALQLYLWALRLADLNRQPLAEGLYRCVDRSLEMLTRVLDLQTGRGSVFGPNDGALFLPITACEYEDFRPLLQTLSLWRRKERIFEAGPWDEDAVWMLGPESLDAPPPVSKGAEARFAAPTAGLFVMTGDRSRVVIRCARFRGRPGHSDQLHMDLSWSGELLAADAGTYLYGGDEPWRNSLAFAAVHNTATVDGKEPMRRSGRFLWTGLAQGEAEFSRDGRWQGLHDGYKALGIIHRRSVEYAGEDAWIVIDDLLGRGPHTVRLHWLLPDYPWEWIAPDADTELHKTLSVKMTGWKDGSGGGLRLRTPAGEVKLRAWSNRPTLWNLYRAGGLIHGGVRAEDIVPAGIRGWRSLRYANKIPALSLAGFAEGQLPVRFISVWTTLPRVK